MKKIRLAGFGYFVLFLFTLSPAFAGNTYTIPISATLPAIPGINTPLIQEEKVISHREMPSDKEQTSTLIQQDNQEQESSLVVQTLYDR